MEAFLMTLALIFLVAPFFIWSFLAFYTRTKKKVINKFGWKVLGMIVAGLALSVICLVILVVVYM
ncbi:hypothetical protein [Spiroplasma culicicola]|uniref:Transmembrane protein n=1 Tax=Spiroplasma culicicola AES-1 TaxID=1276246 RepID=W6AFU1_9MOLU|nr:hypothetical protein [Spiroplasma culicicola]AHI52579.1 hypothetical protein SCULI_v1c02380 [Spiroplasma culicicola AES-1]